MDLGCYGLHALRSLAPWTGGEPEPDAARAGERAGAPGVDEWLDADLHSPSGATAVVRCSMVHPDRAAWCTPTGTSRCHRRHARRGHGAGVRRAGPGRPGGGAHRRRHEDRAPRHPDVVPLPAGGVDRRRPAPAPCRARPRACERWGAGVLTRCYRLAGLSPRPRAAVAPPPGRGVTARRYVFSAAVLRRQGQAPRGGRGRRPRARCRPPCAGRPRPVRGGTRSGVVACPRPRAPVDRSPRSRHDRATPGRDRPGVAREMVARPLTRRGRRPGPRARSARRRASGSCPRAPPGNGHGSPGRTWSRRRSNRC
jgi:hypothetical protein